jgi:preprotein translocase subunit SecG
LVQTLLYGIFFLACILLVASVLLQPGKSDAGALFTSSVSSTAFGPRGTASILSKITIGAAIAFMLSALMLAMPALTGSSSVLQSTGIETTATPTPAPDANTANSGAPAANTSDANSAAPAVNTAGPAANTAAPAANAPANPAAASESVNSAPPANK